MYSSCYLAVVCLLFTLSDAFSKYDGSRYLWYTTSAVNYRSSLPIGNGRLGGLTYGTDIERIDINENSFWSGTFQNRTNPQSAGNYKKIQQQIAAGDIAAAGDAASKYMAGNPPDVRSYQPLVALLIDLGHKNIQGQGYERWLDTYEGSAGCSYVNNNVTYTREYLSSRGSDVLAFRMTASQESSLNASIYLNRTKFVDESTASASKSEGSLLLRARSGDKDAMQFTAGARAVIDGGSIQSDDNKIVVEGATKVDIFFDAETSYRFNKEEDWENEMNSKLDQAISQGYDDIKTEAVSDFSALTGRVTLDIGQSSSNASLPTDVRGKSFSSNPAGDIQYLTLLFNYGRHLLISSSASSGKQPLPANLQGLWNSNYSPAWGSKYTTNINLQMNYWALDVLNLGELGESLWSLIETARIRGQDVACEMYGCTGFVLHHNIDLWGDAAPVKAGTMYAYWPIGGSWLALHMMEHYRFTGDKSFLANRAWQVLVDAAAFHQCSSFDFEGYSTTGPSCSPENTYFIPSTSPKAGTTTGLDIGPTMDNSILFELFSAIIEAAQVINYQGPIVDDAKKYLSKIKPPQIGSKGQIMEWHRDFTPAELGHRHFSPLFGLYPGSLLTPVVSQNLSVAAGVLLDQRMSNGGGGTGWSRAWSMSLYARLYRADDAFKNMNAWAKKFLLGNLWNSDSGGTSPFQIDGNLGWIHCRRT